MRNHYRGATCLALAVLLAAACRPGLAGEQTAASWTACVEATCRVTATDGGRGTGCAFERSQGYVFVLTGAHVATSPAVQCEFWRAGHQSRPLPGRVVLRHEGADVAVVAVAESAFGGTPPPVVPLAPPDWVAAPGQTLSSIGCAGGAWATGWKGHALGYEAADLHFLPAPANGRSGSALFDASGSRIVGLIRARSADSRRGIATSVQAIYRALGNASQRSTAAGIALPPTSLAHTQCSRRICPPRGSLLPFRNPQPRPGKGAPPVGPGAGPLYPTLPYSSGGVPENLPERGDPGLATLLNVDWPRLAEAMAGSAAAQREAADAQMEAAQAQSDYFRRQRQIAEGAEHGRLIERTPEAAGEALDHAASGRFTEALDTATDAPMLGWLGHVIVYALLAATGLTGVPALLVRFGVPMALRAVGNRLKSGLHTEADDVVDEIAARAARSVNGRRRANGAARK